MIGTYCNIWAAEWYHQNKTEKDNLDQASGQPPLEARNKHGDLGGYHSGPGVIIIIKKV